MLIVIHYIVIRLNTNHIQIKIIILTITSSQFSQSTDMLCLFTSFLLLLPKILIFSTCFSQCILNYLLKYYQNYYLKVFSDC